MHVFNMFIAAVCLIFFSLSLSVLKYRFQKYSCEALQSTREIKLIMKFYPCKILFVLIISLYFETYLIEFLWEIIFGVISGNYLKLLFSSRKIHLRRAVKHINHSRIP